MIHTPSCFDKAAAACPASLRKSSRGLVLTAAVMAMTSTAYGGPLAAAYDKYKSAHPTLKSYDYILKAADQEIETQKKGYMPNVILEAKQLAVGQDIRQRDSIFQSGSDRYSNSRAKLEIQQPLIDMSVKHKIKEAESFRAYHEGVKSANVDVLTRDFVVSYLDALRYGQLELSAARVIARLEKEQQNVEARFKERLATLEEVESINVSLVAARQEKSLYLKERMRCLSIIGLSPSDGSPVSISAMSKLPVPVGSQELQLPEARILRSEVDAYDHKISATLSGNLPRLNLYGLLEHDDAGGSQFGGERRLNGYEVGLYMSWDLFDGGINKSEAKKLEYLKKAKQAELDASLAAARNKSSLATQSLKLSESNLMSIDKLVEHQRSISEAAETSYKEGGEKTYINMVNAYLVLEAQLRQQTQAKFDHIGKQAELYAAHAGWSEGLVRDLDKLFSAAN